MSFWFRCAVLLVSGAVLASCSRDPQARADNTQRQLDNLAESRAEDRELRTANTSFFDLFGSRDSDTQINVNKHLWAASLDILSFLPIASVDPFSGVITTDWGRVSGSSAPYRATVFVSGPALDARSLRVAVFRGGGSGVAVNDSVAAQIEDAILTRARQLRIADRDL